jgi:hypothetical protein
MRWMLNPANKATQVAPARRSPEASLKTSPTQAFDATLKGFQKDGALDMDGVRNVLKLRAQFEGGTPAIRGSTSI